MSDEWQGGEGGRRGHEAEVAKAARWRRNAAKWDDGGRGGSWRDGTGREVEGGAGGRRARAGGRPVGRFNLAARRTAQARRIERDAVEGVSREKSWS